MPTVATVYLDESGNDGPNYVSVSEPFYVLAGWIVPDARNVDASVLMEQFRQDHSPQSHDLKFRMFRRKPYLLCEQMTKLGTLGLVPVFVLAEKRYCISGKIVETFLDPYYCQKLRSQFGFDLAAKREIANTLYERLPIDVLNTFAAAYREPNHEGLKLCLASVVDACRTHINTELAQLMLGSENRLSEIAAAEVHAVDVFGKGSATINAPCLISMAMLLEQIGREKHMACRRLVHDEQGPYQTDFERIFRAFQNGNEEERFQLEGMDVPFGAIRTIDNLEFQQSHHQPLVQAADLLAGSIAHLAKKLINDEQLHPQESELAHFAFAPLNIPDLKLANPVCSQRMLKRIEEAFRAYLPDTAVESQHIQSSDSVCWTSTLPSGHKIPLLPASLAEEAERPTPHHRIKIDLPLFSVANLSRELALVLPPELRLNETDRNSRCYLLWTDKTLAERFLSEQDWVAHQVIEFGPAELTELIEKLRAAMQWTDWVYFQFPEPHGRIPIEKLADDLERVWERCKRLFRTGLSAEVYQKHEIRDDEVWSALMGNGDYAAIRLSDGLRGSAKTRAGAIEELRSAIEKADA